MYMSSLVPRPDLGTRLVHELLLPDTLMQHFILMTGVLLLQVRTGLPMDSLKPA